MRQSARRALLAAGVILCAVLVLKGSALLVPSGSWAPEGTMANARAGASAALLQDGRILITGGDPGTGPVASADFFETDGTIPTPPSAPPPMINARSQHVSVTLQDGRVLVAGGLTGGSATNTAEIFDPVANSWTSVGSGMTEARSGATAAVLQDGRVLVAGGQNGSAISSTIEIFDPTLGTFMSAGMMSSPRTQHSMAVLQDGRVLIVGGNSGNNGTPPAPTPVASTDIYQPVAGATGAVTAGPSLATARFGHSATTLLNGQVVVIGGNNGNAIPAQMDVTPAELVDFTAATPAFTTLATILATPREGHLAFLLPNNNNVLIVGGASAGTTIASAELFSAQDSPQGVWTYGFGSTGTMNAARSSATGSANQVNVPTTIMQRNGVLMVAGGTDANGNALNTTEAYGYPTVQTDQSDYPPGTTVTITGSGFQPGETVTIQLVESPLIDTHGPFTVTVLSDGTFSDSSFVTDTHDIDVQFYLTATGQNSGSQAQNTFTDASNPKLVVTLAGTGSGKVTSSDGNISCPTTCSFTYSGNFSNVILTATPNGGNAFTGWSGAGGCTGTGTCSASETGNGTFAATATFATGGPTKLAITSVNGGSNPTAGTAFPVVIQSENSGGQPASVSASTSVSLSLNTGTGTLSGTLTGTIAAGTDSVTISGVTYTKAESGVVLSATRTSGDSLGAGNSAPFTVNAGTATKLVITGSGTQTAGLSQSLTITAEDAFGNTDTTYAGNHTLTFSGANSSSNPVTAPTVTNRSGTATSFGTGTSITFTSGVSTAGGVMTLYDVQTAAISVTDGTISSSGSGNLSVTVSVGSLAKMAFVLASPQTNAVAFTGTNTLTAEDSWGNTVTTFNASTDNVNITANSPLTGAVSGLGSGSNNILNQTANFSSGVANLTGLMKYTGNAATGTFMATTSITGKTGTSGSVTINAGTATQYLVTSSNNSPVAGTAVTITAQLADAGGNPVPTSGKVITWSNTGSGASFGSPTSTTNISGVATVTFTTGTTVTTYTVTATDNTSVTGTSGNITTTAGTATQLVFLQQPTNTVAGVSISPAVEVEFEDANGNVLTADNGTNISIAILNNPGAGTLSGTATVKDVNGISTFTGLSINKTGNGYTLTAHAGTNLNATSSGFNITPAAPATVQVETKADGTGTIVPAQNVTAGSSVTVFAITRDQFGNFVANAAATWSLVNKTGGVASGDLVQSGDTKSAVFTGHLVGTGQIQAVAGSFTGTSGTLTVVAGTPVSGNSTITGTSPVTADGTSTSTITITLKDANNNPVSGVTPTFSATGSNNTYGACSATNASGVSTCTLTSTKAETKTLSISTPLSVTGGMVTFQAGALASITISPTSAMITAGGSQAYTATGYDSYGNTLGDVTISTTFSMTPDGSCTGASCTANIAGQHTVTGNDSGAKGTASLTVSPGPVASLALSPATATISSGGSQSYTATGYDSYGNSLGDVTSSTIFSISPDGSCTNATCTATLAGTHTVTGNNSGAKGTATLTVVAPVPFINATTPVAVVPGGSGFTLTVLGTGFINGNSNIYWDGSLLSGTNCTAAAAPQLAACTATVPGTNIASAGTANITVVNPAPSGASNVVFLPIAKSKPFVTTQRTDYGAGTNPNQVVVGDFNGDGKEDIAVANPGGGGNLTILLGNGDGTFTPAASPNVTNAYALAVGDFNRDGNLDLAVTDDLGAVYILLGNGDGTFSVGPAISTGNGPVWVAVGDFNGDGNLDLAIANNTDNTLTILLGKGDGTFTAATSPSTGTSPKSVAVGDFNGDGIPDLAVANAGSNNLTILLGKGDGTFTTGPSPNTGTNPYQVAVGDFNGDGKLDLAIANNTDNTLTILLGNGDGTFTAAASPSTGKGPTSVAVDDFNSDGILDLAVTNQGDNTVTLLLGNRDGTFTANAVTSPSTPSGPIDVAVGDFNGDGRLDFVTANSGFSNASVFLQTVTVPITFVQTGIAGDSTGTVVTYSGTQGGAPTGNVSLTASQLATSAAIVYFDAGTTVTYSYSSPVNVTGGTKQYRWLSTAGTGSSSGATTQSGSFSITSTSSVTASYQVQYQVTFTAVDQSNATIADATGTVVTVNSAAQTPNPYQAYYDQGAMVTFSFQNPLASTVAGKQYRFVSASTSSPISVSAATTVTGSYQAQSQVTFAQSGIPTTDIAATTTVVTVNGTPKAFSTLSFTAYYDTGSAVTYSYASPIASSNAGERFVLTTPSPSPASPITVSGATTVTGTYKVQYQVTFTAGGTIPIGGSADTTGTLIAITAPNSQTYNKTAANLPFSYYYDNGATVSVTYTTPIASTTAGKRYALTAISGGIVALPSTSFTVSGAAATITGTYKTQYQVTFAQSGIPSTDIAGTTTVVTVSGTPEPFSALPYSAYFDSGSAVNYSYSTPIASSNAGERFVLTTPSPSPASPITVSGATTVTGTYKVQYQVTFTAGGTIPIGGSADTTGTLIAITAPNSQTYNKTAANLPFSYYYDNGATVSVTYTTPIASTTAGKRYALTAISGGIVALPSTSFTVNGAAATITGTYKTQYQITFTANGTIPISVSADTSGTLIAIAGTNGYTYSTNEAASALAFSDWFDNGATLSATYKTPIASTTAGKRYALTSISGGTPSGNVTAITVAGSLTVTGTYKTQYLLTLAVSPSIPGGTSNITSTPSSGDGYYDATALVSLTAATPVAGGTGTQWRFDHWSGGASGSTNPVSITMSAPQSVTANYIEQYLLTLSITAGVPNGLTNITGGTSGYYYDTGTVLTLKATTPVAAGTGIQWRFNNWTGTTTGNSASLSVTMSAPQTIMANYIEQYLLTLSITAGVPNGLTNITGGTSGYYYDTGTVLTLKATTPVAAGTGIQWRFNNWTGTTTGNSALLSVTMSAPQTIAADYIEQYLLTLSITAGVPNGLTNITGGTSGYYYDTGTVLPLVAATPVAAGTGTQWRFNSWTGTTTGNSASLSVTMSAPQTIMANYIEQYLLTLSITAGVPNGLTNITGGTSGYYYDTGTVLTLKATTPVAAGTGIQWRFNNWTGTTTGNSALLSVTMSAPQTIAADYIEQYLLTLSITAGVPNGLTNITGGTSGYYYDTGTVLTLKATTPVAAGTGIQWRFNNWTGTTTGSSASISVTMNAPQTIAANYIEQFLLTLGITPAPLTLADITGGATGTFYDYGTPLTLAAATPISFGGTGYVFSAWSGSITTSSNNPLSVTMSQPQMITANYNTWTLTWDQTTDQQGCTTTFCAQYSDPTGLVAQLMMNGSPVSGATINFTAGTTAWSASTNSGIAADTNPASTPADRVTQAPGSSYTATGSCTMSQCGVALSITNPFTIAPEDAAITYTGQEYFSSTNSTMSVPVTYTLQDATATGVSSSIYDAFPGDITKATAALTLTGISTSYSQTCNPTAIAVSGENGSNGLPSTATLACTFTGVPVGATYSLSAYPRSNSYYAFTTGDTGMVSVVTAMGGTGFITGGGHQTATCLATAGPSGSNKYTTAGLMQPAPGTKMNFGFETKYQKSGKLQGGVNLIIRSQCLTITINGYTPKPIPGTDICVYQVQVPQGLLTSLTETLTPTPPYAELVGSAMIYDVTWPTPVQVGSKVTLQLQMYDVGDPGPGANVDPLAIQLTDNTNGLWFSNNWNGAKTVISATAPVIQGGDLQVH